MIVMMIIMMMIATLIVIMIVMMIVMITYRALVGDWIDRSTRGRSSPAAPENVGNVASELSVHAHATTSELLLGDSVKSSMAHSASSQPTCLRPLNVPRYLRRERNRWRDRDRDRACSLDR